MEMKSLTLLFLSFICRISGEEVPHNISNVENNESDEFWKGWPYKDNSTATSRLTALYDHITNLVIYKDESIPACLMEQNNDNKKENIFLRILSVSKLELDSEHMPNSTFITKFCGELPLYIIDNSEEALNAVVKKRVHRSRRRKRCAAHAQTAVLSEPAQINLAGDCGKGHGRGGQVHVTQRFYPGRIQIADSDGNYHATQGSTQVSNGGPIMFRIRPEVRSGTRQYSTVHRTYPVTSNGQILTSNSELVRSLDGDSDLETNGRDIVPHGSSSSWSRHYNYSSSSKSSQGHPARTDVILNPHTVTDYISHGDFRRTSGMQDQTESFNRNRVEDTSQEYLSGGRGQKVTRMEEYHSSSVNGGPAEITGRRRVTVQNTGEEPVIVSQSEYGNTEEDERQREYREALARWEEQKRIREEETRRYEAERQQTYTRTQNRESQSQYQGQSQHGYDDRQQGRSEAVEQEERRSTSGGASQGGYVQERHDESYNSGDRTRQLSKTRHFKPSLTWGDGQYSSSSQYSRQAEYSSSSARGGQDQNQYDNRDQGRGGYHSQTEISSGRAQTERDEADMRMQTHEEDLRRQAEADLRRQSEIDERRRTDEAELRRQTYEENLRRQAEAETRRQQAEEEQRRQAAIVETRRQQAIDTEARRQQAAEIEARRQTEMESRQRQTTNAEDVRRQAEEDYRRQAVEAEELRRQTNEAENARRIAEAETRRQTLEAETRRQSVHSSYRGQSQTSGQEERYGQRTRVEHVNIREETERTGGRVRDEHSEGGAVVRAQVEQTNLLGQTEEDYEEEEEESDHAGFGGRQEQAKNRGQVVQTRSGHRTQHSGGQGQSRVEHTSVLSQSEHSSVREETERSGGQGQSQQSSVRGGQTGQSQQSSVRGGQTYTRREPVDSSSRGQTEHSNVRVQSEHSSTLEQGVEQGGRVGVLEQSEHSGSSIHGETEQSGVRGQAEISTGQGVNSRGQHQQQSSNVRRVGQTAYTYRRGPYSQYYSGEIRLTSDNLRQFVTTTPKPIGGSQTISLESIQRSSSSSSSSGATTTNLQNSNGALDWVYRPPSENIQINFPGGQNEYRRSYQSSSTSGHQLRSLHQNGGTRSREPEVDQDYEDEMREGRRTYSTRTSGQTTVEIPVRTTQYTERSEQIQTHARQPQAAAESRTHETILASGGSGQVSRSSQTTSQGTRYNYNPNQQQSSGQSCHTQEFTCTIVEDGNGGRSKLCRPTVGGAAAAGIMQQAGASALAGQKDCCMCCSC